MKNTLRFFGLLDLVSIVLLTPQLYNVLSAPANIPTGIFSVLKITFTCIIYVLLFISASALYRISKAAMISYFIQFLLRLAVWVFSFGFLTYLSEFTETALVFEWLFRIVFILEFFRLYFTIRIYRRV